MTDMPVETSSDEIIFDIEPQKNISIEFGDSPVPVLATLDIDVSCEEHAMDVEQMDEVNVELGTQIIVQHSGADPYNGEYTVSPSFEIQTLETKNKYMRDDVEVEAIAVSRVSNLSGGTTVYIGGIFDA